MNQNTHLSSNTKKERSVILRVFLGLLGGLVGAVLSQLLFIMAASPVWETMFPGMPFLEGGIPDLRFVLASLVFLLAGIVSGVYLGFKKS